MDITGIDNVIFTTCHTVDPIVRVVEFLRSRWPNMLVDGDFADALAASTPGTSLPATGEIYFCRDKAMDVFWDDHGYDLMEDGEGPLALFFRRRTCVFFGLGEVDEALLRDASRNGIEPPSPYTAWLSCPEIREITVVTPGVVNEDPFSTSVWQAVCDACRGVGDAGT